MHFPLPGYVVARALRASAASRGFEVAREGDGQLFIARIREFEDPLQQLRVVQQLDRLRALELPGIARLLRVERVGKSLVTIAERAPGLGLHERSRGYPLALGELMAIAEQLAAIVAGLHAQMPMHGDLRPATILVDPETLKLSLADAGIGRVLDQGREPSGDPDFVDALLPYLAPEQLGRSPIEPDARGDLYAIGVTLYELLTGRRPFAANTASELIRAQLVRRPRPPQELRPGIPVQLAAIVMRLLEKQPDQRYQSARGLAFDLGRLIEAIAEGETEPSFTLGERDHPTSLQMPRRLYGRTHLLAQLERELTDVRERGESKLVFVVGEAGLGKSALLRSFVPPLGSGVMLANARFDADTRGWPYRGFVDALALLVEELSKGEARKSELREHLNDRLGPLVEVACELVPSVAGLFAGDPPRTPSTALAPSEIERRVHVTLRRLLSALSERGPIVLLLDDAQRLDQGSRELLRVLARGIGGPVLMIVAVQTRADDDAGSLGDLRRALLASDSALELQLEPLALRELIAMLSSMLGRPAGEVGELAELVRARTGGNPLLVRHFLRELVERGALASGEAGWRWQPEDDSVAAVSDVAGLLQARLDRLAPDELGLLQKAACLGFTVSTSLLQAIAGLDDVRLATLLARLEGEGMLVGEGVDHRFAHERLLELALGSLAAEPRARVHWQIAGVLRERGATSFELADHLVVGLPAAGELDERERERLVELTLAAGRQAANAAAWTNAERYLATALILASGLTLAPAELLAIRFDHAQALALVGRDGEADRAFAALFELELGLAEYGRLIERRLAILSGRDRHREAIELGMKTLARFGLRPHGSTAGILIAALRGWRALQRLGRERLLTLPEVRDERIDVVMRIIDGMQTSTFLIERRLCIHLNAIHTRLVVEHGFHPTAPRALAQFGLLLVALDRPLEAAQLDDWALELVERAPQSRPRVETAARLFVWPHTRPLAASLHRLDDLFEQALAIGDRDTAGYVAGLGLRGLLEVGAPLRETIAQAKRVHDGLIGWATRDQRMLLWSSKAVAEALAARPGEPSPDLPAILASEPEVGEVIRYGSIVGFALVDWLLGRHESTYLALERISGDFDQVTIGTWLIGRFSILRACSAVERVEQGKLSARAVQGWLRRSLVRLRRRAKLAPANFAAAAEIVDAELCRLKGDHDGSLRAYEHARSLAEQHGQLYAAGIAAERLAELAARIDQPTTRAGALRLARDVFQRWGALAAVARIELEHPDLFVGHDHEISTVTPASGETDWDVDGASMLATMQAICEEIHLEQVITRVLAAAIEHAGADRGVLLLERDGAIGIVAEGGVGSVSEYLDAPTALVDAGDRLPRRVIENVLRTGKAVIFDEFDSDPELARDPYFANHAVPSLLCLAIVKHQRRVGALLLEHESPMQQFTFERLEILRTLAAQAASSLDNARLYDALQRSEAQWRSLVDGVPDVIAVLDERDRIEFVNHVGGFPVDPASVRGVPAELLIAADQLESWRSALHAVRRGRGPRELELRIAPPGHPPRWYLMRLAGIVVEGKVGKIIAISTEIEDRKREEDNRARLEAQLRQQQRLESLGTLASGVAHEINNPIQGIMNYAELIAGRPGDREQVEEFAGEISHESQRVATIVRNLLAFSRQEREQQQTERVEVPALVESTLSLIRAVLRKDKIELSVELPDELPALRCRPAQIQQIVMNLVTNARDAINERQVVAEHRRLRLLARSWVREARPWLRLSIEDRGGGIDEAVLGRIFDPFFTTKGRDQGTGLGLAVSHGIAVEHGGRLWVDNKPGVGATFHLDLPALVREP
ncbi:AAA family ATPase [Nannocystaceae bacterium ST9]